MRMPKINEKMYIYDGTPCTVVDVWDEDEYHSAGFNVGIVTKYGNMGFSEFSIDDIGCSIGWERPVHGRFVREYGKTP